MREEGKEEAIERMKERKDRRDEGRKEGTEETNELMREGWRKWKGWLRDENKEGIKRERMEGMKEQRKLMSWLEKDRGNGKYVLKEREVEREGMNGRK